MAESSENGASKSTGEIVLYNTEDGRAQVQLRLVDGTVWLTQFEMAELFDTGVPNINKHITSVFEDGELLEDRTISYQEIVRQEGSRLVRREVKTYNLDMILAVGYRVRSPRGVQFRQWASTVLSEYLIKGFAMNDERLKEPGGLDYFDELLERIRDIRASEKRFYQKVRDLFALSADYDSKTGTAQKFFATIQNKLSYAITSHTAAELIVRRADPAALNMGLTSFKGTVVRKGDITIAKNYLDQDEITTLNLLVNQFLEFAELRARRRQTITMAEWTKQTDRFLELNDFPILDHAGRVSHDKMKEVVCGRFEQFQEERRALEARRAEEEAEREAAELLAEDTDALAELERRHREFESGSTD